LTQEKHIDRAISNRLWMEMYKEKGRGWLPVLTNSMVPLIQPGDHVLIYRVTPEQVHCGDIIAFKRNGDLYVHRALRKWRTPSGFCFMEKGDATYSYGHVSADEVFGRVATVRRGSRMCDLTSPLSRLTSIALTIWLYRTTYAVNLMKHSGNRMVRRIGRALSQLLLVISSSLVRACFIVWYPSGLLAGRNGEVSLPKAVQMSAIREPITKEEAD